MIKCAQANKRTDRLKEVKKNDSKNEDEPTKLLREKKTAEKYLSCHYDCKKAH